MGVYAVVADSPAAVAECGGGFAFGCGGVGLVGCSSVDGAVFSLGVIEGLEVVELLL